MADPLILIVISLDRPAEDWEMRSRTVSHTLSLG
jgi:hypothetical protein